MLVYYYVKCITEVTTIPRRQTLRMLGAVVTTLSAIPLELAPLLLHVNIYLICKMTFYRHMTEL